MGARRGHQRETLKRCRAVVLGGVVCAAGALASVPAGCLAPTSYGWQGERQVMAAYSGWTLRSDLPKGVTVPAANVAADRALEHSGYTVTARDETSDSGRVVARPPDGRLFRRVVVETRRLPAGSRVAITIEPGGDEGLSREILERMLTRLGL